MSSIACFCRLLFWLSVSSVAAAPFSIPWSKEHFGPDGPWQAVMVTVGGNDSSLTLGAQSNVEDVKLYPGGAWGSYILSNRSCEPSTPTCVSGGTWTPQGESTEIQYPATLENDAWGVNTSDNVPYNTVALTTGPDKGTTVFNCSVVSVGSIKITDPNGSVRGPTLGTFSLGIQEGRQAQMWSTSDSNADSPPAIGWMFAGYLYNQSHISSYSYGLHIGAARYNYSGSLLFGGYDKGRAIGPYTSFNTEGSKSQSFTLLDIELDVEIGGSPFNFSRQTGLLQGIRPENQKSLSVFADPLVPSLRLPGRTCEAIAQLLPITYDANLGYYLWDVDDPQYTKVVSSPAYLNFVFPPAPGESDLVGIKVPLTLLNLTLERPITTSPTPYFPCISFEPENNFYILGRAFLQAAFLGHNFNTKTVWLTQAPGPGDARDGMGVLPTDLADGATTLDLFREDGHFARSWKDYWTQLDGGDSSPDGEAPPGASPGEDDNVNKRFGLSTGAKAGIGVGAAAVVILAVAGFFCLRRRKHAAKEGLDSADEVYPKAENSIQAINSEPVQLGDPPESPQELDSSVAALITPLQELPGHETIEPRRVIS